MLSHDLLASLAEQTGLASPSIVISTLDGAGKRTELEPDRALPAASMIKVPIAAAMCAQWAHGERRPDETVVISEANMTANDGASPFAPGYRARLDELTRLMIVRSDNVATNTLIERLDRRTITAYLRGIGLDATAVHRKLSGGNPLISDPDATGERNAHPARDAARLFERIALGELPGADWLAATLADQEWNEKLSRGLRTGDRFAHKTGDTSQATHDGGILTTAEGRWYVVVVYTALASSPEGDRRLGAFMEMVRECL